MTDDEIKKLKEENEDLRRALQKAIQCHTTVYNTVYKATQDIQDAYSANAMGFLYAEVVKRKFLSHPVSQGEIQ